MSLPFLFCREAHRPQRNVTSTAVPFTILPQLLLQLRTNLRQQQQEQLVVDQPHLPYSLQRRPQRPRHHSSNKRPENVLFPKVLTFDSHMLKWTELLKTMVKPSHEHIQMISNIFWKMSIKIPAIFFIQGKLFHLSHLNPSFTSYRRPGIKWLKWNIFHWLNNQAGIFENISSEFSKLFLQAIPLPLTPLLPTIKLPPMGTWVLPPPVASSVAL